MKISAALLKTLEGQYTELDGRLREVSGHRATYANQLAAVRQRSENLARVIKDLSDVRASQAAALSASLIARLDEPQPGNSPVGPSFSMIVLAGFGGGLIFGLGLVFLMAPLGNLWGRRWTDYIGIGRRASDKDLIGTIDPSGLPHGRRDADAPLPQRLNRRRTASRTSAGETSRCARRQETVPRNRGSAAPTVNSAIGRDRRARAPLRASAAPSATRGDRRPAHSSAKTALSAPTGRYARTTHRIFDSDCPASAKIGSRISAENRGLSRCT